MDQMEGETEREGEGRGLSMAFASIYAVSHEGRKEGRRRTGKTRLKREIRRIY